MTPALLSCVSNSQNSVPATFGESCLGEGRRIPLLRDWVNKPSSRVLRFAF